ncbi:MAG: hypothetical protein KQJ78_04700 [Deltaproteobacteria bacterium]|nr:hypothetical protein [Deltaproteobacteria bacterium]
MLKVILNNWSWKILSLVVAVGLWAHVVGQEKTEIALNVPVAITGAPANLVVSDQVLPNVEVRLFGPRNLIRLVASDGLVKNINLTDMQAGEHVFQVLPEDFNLPPGVAAVGISPASIRVDLSPRHERKVPVRPVLSGKPAPGYEVSEITFTPDKVAVSGMKEQVDEVDWIWTVPIDVGDLKSNTTRKVALRPSLGKNVLVRPDQVEARIIVRPLPGREDADSSTPLPVTP